MLQAALCSGQSLYRFFYFGNDGFWADDGDGIRSPDSGVRYRVSDADVALSPESQSRYLKRDQPLGVRPEALQAKPTRSSASQSRYLKRDQPLGVRALSRKIQTFRGYKISYSPEIPTFANRFGRASRRGTKRPYFSAR